MFAVLVRLNTTEEALTTLAMCIYHRIVVSAHCSECEP